MPVRFSRSAAVGLALIVILGGLEAYAIRRPWPIASWALAQFGRSVKIPLALDYSWSFRRPDPGQRRTVVYVLIPQSLATLNLYEVSKEPGSDVRVKKVRFGLAWVALIVVASAAVAAAWWRSLGRSAARE